MNERIRELLVQAMTEVGPDDTDLKTLEKFAELIVRECADTAYQSLYEDRVFDDVPANIRRNGCD